MYEEMWEAYRQNIATLGFPQADTYQWSQGGNVWYRIDFDSEISLLWNGRENGQSVIETIDRQNGLWRGSFWPAPNQFEGDAYVRRDEALDFYWQNVRNSGPFTNTNGFSGHWEADIGGLVSFYTLSVKVQGNAEIFVDGDLEEKITSPEQITTIKALQFGIGAEKVEIFYWQSAGNPGQLSLTTDNPLIKTVFASEGIKEAETLPNPDFTYALYPPGLRDEQLETYGNGICPIDNTDGVALHEEESSTGQFFIGCVDLTIPHLRFENVMANDVFTVNPPSDQRETVTSMVNRQPHILHNPILAFNADYFGTGHGPEGFTVSNGLRIDGPLSNDQDGNETNRVSHSVSRVNWVDLESKLPGDVGNPVLHLNRFYNTSGGGPTILKDGVVVSNPCELEGFPLEVCFTNTHTAVGVSEDNQTFIVVVAEAKSATEMGQILQAYGAYNGIKLSGGTTSQLWYSGEEVVSGSPVANAMVIFREDVPRHDAVILEQSQFPVVQAGEPFSVTLRLGNTGFLPWEKDLDYALQHVDGERFSIPSPRFLPATVPTGYDLAITLEGIAPLTPGAYQSIWQLVYQDSQGFIEPVSEELGFLVTVVPEGTSLDFTDSLQQFIDQFLAEIEGNVRDYLDKLAQEIEPRIAAELLKLIPPELQCLLGMGMIFSNGWFLTTWRRKRGQDE